MEKDHRDIVRKGIQPAKEKQKGKKGGRKCRKRQERNITPSSFSGRKGRGGNKSPPPRRVLPAPLLILAGNLYRGGRVLFEPSPPSNICPAPTAAPIHSETWWGASREFREWTLQGLGSTLPKLPENYPEETAPAFNMYLLPAGGVCLH